MVITTILYSSSKPNVSPRVWRLSPVSMSIDSIVSINSIISIPVAPGLHRITPLVQLAWRRKGDSQLINISTVFDIFGITSSWYWGKNHQWGHESQRSYIINMIILAAGFINKLHRKLSCFSLYTLDRLILNPLAVSPVVSSCPPCSLIT